MQKVNYLKYFKKNYCTTSPTQESYDEIEVFNQHNQQNENNQKSQIKTEQHNLSKFYKQKEVFQAKQNMNHKNMNHEAQSKKKLGTRSFLFPNKTHQIPKNRLKLSLNNSKQQYSLPNIQQTKIKVNEVQHKPKDIPQNSNVPKHLSQSLYGPDFRKSGSDSNNRIKTLQSRSMYNTCGTDGKFFAHPIRPYNRNKTAPNKNFRTLKTTFGDLNSSCRNYNDFYTISLQNLRMGWRIVNTRSMIQEYLNSTYLTYHMYNGNLINKQKFKGKEKRSKNNLQSKQMKNVIKVFFDKNNLFSAKNKQNIKIMQKIQPKDQIQQYIQSQSRAKQVDVEPFEQKQNNFSNCPNQQNQNHVQKRKKSIAHQPCFIKSTYRKNDRSFNTRLCSKQKKIKCGNRNKKMQTQPNKRQQTYEFMPSYEFQVFGKGSTIIQLRNIEIKANPTIKSQDMFMLEIMKTNYTASSQNQKITCTPPIKYSDLKKGVKFAVDLKIGDFLPLKIWKYHGINAIEFGVIDLNLIIFKQRKNYFKNMESNSTLPTQSNEFSHIKLYKQQNQKANISLERQILSYHVEQKLRRNKKSEIEVTISMDCFMYNKKFTRMARLSTQKSKNQQKQLIE